VKFKKYIIGAVSTSLLALVGTAAQATSLEASQFNTLVHDAEACVVGTVENVSYATVEGRAYTLTTFNVTDVAFGDVKDTVTVKTPGGRLTSAPIAVSETVAGMPRFFGQSSYLLILDDNGSNEMAIAGAFQGAVAVVNDQVRLPESSAILDVEAALEAINGIRATADSQAVQ